jgi:hypothetical protein
VSDRSDILFGVTEFPQNERQKDKTDSATALRLEPRSFGEAVHNRRSAGTPKIRNRTFKHKIKTEKTGFLQAFSY